MSAHLAHIAALRVERQAVLDFCGPLSPAEWDAPSAASGWRVRDVIAHMGGSAHAFLTPGLVTLMRTRQIERLNDDAVAARADSTPAALLDEFALWSGRAARLLRIGTVGPLGAIRIPLGELGYFPLRLMAATAIFDWHTHLRHDIAPALGIPAPPTDTPRMTAVIEWLTALLQQSHQHQLGWLTEPAALTLDGPGGGTWRIEPGSGRGGLRVTRSDHRNVAAHITGGSEEFPVWATARRPWRECDVTITGDQLLAAKVLDSINLV